MSQENVDFVTALYGGASTMDKRELLAALPEFISQSCHPDIEWVEDPHRADGRVHHGHAGVLESFERWLEDFDEYDFQPERFVDCGDDVLVAGREQARGAASGASVTSHIYAVFTIREGKIQRYREFYDEQEALAAVGL